MADFLEIVPIINGTENENKFTTSIGCYQLGNILIDWGNSYFHYTDNFTLDDIAILKSCYGKESVAVQEEDEEFNPNIVNIYKLITVLEKLKNKMLYPFLKD